jgi:hypothetical protein
LRVYARSRFGQLRRDRHQVADWFASSDSDSSAEALGIFTQGRGHRLDPRSFHGKEVLLDDRCPDGANVGVATQNRDEMGLAVPAVFNFSNEPIQPKAYSRGGVLHSLRVFQHSEALVGILHDFLLWLVRLGCDGWRG